MDPLIIFLGSLVGYLAMGVATLFVRPKNWEGHTFGEAVLWVVAWPLIIVMGGGLLLIFMYFDSTDWSFSEWKRVKFDPTDTVEFYTAKVFLRDKEHVEGMFVGVAYTEKHPIRWFIYRRFPYLAWRSLVGKESRK